MCKHHSATGGLVNSSTICFTLKLTKNSSQQLRRHVVEPYTSLHLPCIALVCCIFWHLRQVVRFPVRKTHDGGTWAHLLRFRARVQIRCLGKRLALVSNLRMDEAPTCVGPNTPTRTFGQISYTLIRIPPHLRYLDPPNKGASVEHITVPQRVAMDPYRSSTSDESTEYPPYIHS